MQRRPKPPSADSPAPLAAPPAPSAATTALTRSGGADFDVPATVTELGAVPVISDQPLQGSGGVLQPGAFYIPRALDGALPIALLSGSLCYVLGPRQSGKSSLRVRTQEVLRTQGVVCATLDLSAIGTPQSAEVWCYALCEHLAHQLGMPSPEPFYTREPLLAPAVRFQRYLRDQVLVQKPVPLVLFIEEVDVTLSLPFPRADFFAVLRALHDGRAEDPVLRRLTLCLLGANPPLGLGGHSGAAAPGADDPARSLFAVARILELHDFNGAEARAFLGHLPRLPRGPQAWLDAVLYFTGGHPVLTQRLCEVLSAEGAAAASKQEALFRAPGQSDLEAAVLRGGESPKELEELEERAQVARLVQALFLDHAARGDRGLSTVPLLAAIDRAFASAQDPRAREPVLRMLELYRRIIGASVAAETKGSSSSTAPRALWQEPGLLRRGRVAATRQDEAELALRATGLIIEAQDDEGACLVVRNRVFALLFDEAWTQRHLATRPLAAALQRWRAAERGPEGLLQGEELAQALTWAAGRADVDPDERELLLRSLVAARAADKERAEAQAVARALQVKEDRERLQRRQRQQVQALIGGIIGLLLVMIGLAVDAARSREVRALAEVARLRESQRRAARERELSAEQAAHEGTRKALAQAQAAQQAALRDTDDARAALGRQEVRAKDLEGKTTNVFKKRIAQKAGVWVDTDVDAEQVDRVIQQKGWPALRRCYPAAPLLPAPLKMEITVLPDGAVQEATIDGPEATRACAVAALRGLRFARFVGSHFVRISYVLRARGR